MKAGGLAATMPPTANALEAEGYSVAVCGIRDDGASSSAYLSNAVEEVRGWGPNGFKFAPNMDKFLRDVQPKIVHLQGLWTYPSIAASRWRRRTGGSVVISPHGMLDPWALEFSKRKKQLAYFAFESASLSGAKCLHALNSNELESMRSFGLRNPIAVIPNGTTFGPFPNCHSEEYEWADKKRKTLLFLGRIHPKKGLEETLRGWELARSGSPEIRKKWRFVIAGWDDGGHLASLRKLSEELSVQDSVHFIGPVFGNEKEALLAHSDAFILASHSEGLPMGILEAWSHGLPVIMSRSCNLSQAFSIGAGREVDVEPTSICRELTEFLLGSDLSSCGLRGLAFARESFSWTSIARSFSELYNWLQDKADKPEFIELN